MLSVGFSSCGCFQRCSFFAGINATLPLKVLTILILFVFIIPNSHLSPICQQFIISRMLCLQMLFSSQLKNHFSVKLLCVTQNNIMTSFPRLECQVFLLLAPCFSHSSYTIIVYFYISDCLWNRCFELICEESKKRKDSRFQHISNPDLSRTSYYVI